jgi:hypothetical protein
MKSIIVAFLILTLANITFAQVTPCDCSANVNSGDQNFSSLTWTGTGCPTAGSTSYSGNLCLSLDNGANLIMDKNFSINGGLGMSNNGNSTFTLPTGKTLSISGDFGDDSNNNVTFAINGNLVVGGGIYGKNSNAFDASGTGTGSITAGSLNFSGTPTCTSPSNCSGFNWSVTTCSPAGSSFCDFIVLPVTLLFFDAQSGNNEVNLSWATATESNSSYFSIERSVDGINFSEIGQRNAAGNSALKIDYEFVDANPVIGRMYYRLKEVDSDGVIKYFNADVVDYAGKKGVAVFPNPYEQGELAITLNFSGGEGARGIISDLSGNEIESFTMQNAAFKSSSLDLKAGTYLIKVYDSGASYVTKFIVH